MAGVVVVVPQGGVLERRAQGLQQGDTLQVTHEEVAALVEEALRAQCLEDQPLDLGLRVAAVLALVDGMNDLEGRRDPRPQRLAQGGLGADL